MRESVLTIISETTSTNADGFEVKVETTVDVPCTLKSVSRSEFYAAYAQGLTADAVFVVHYSAYNGERRLRFEGVNYTAIRSYERADEYVEITARKGSAAPTPTP